MLCIQQSACICTITRLPVATHQLWNRGHGQVTRVHVIRIHRRHHLDAVHERYAVANDISIPLRRLDPGTQRRGRARQHHRLIALNELQDEVPCITFIAGWPRNPRYLSCDADGSNQSITLRLHTLRL